MNIDEFAPGCSRGLNATRSAYPGRTAAVLALLAGLHAAPVAALDVRLTPLVGYRTDEPTWGGPWLPLNDFGTAAYQNIFAGGADGISLTDGDRRFVGATGFGPGVSSSYAYTINNVNLVTYQRSFVLQGSPTASQLFAGLPGENSGPITDPYRTVGLLNIETNSTGGGVGYGNAFTDGYSVIRFDGRGSYNPIALPSGARVVGQISFRPQIVENGDIYVGVVTDQSSDSYQILRYSPSPFVPLPVPAPSPNYLAPVAVYSSAPGANLGAWAVNSRGDLVVSEFDSHGAGLGVRVIDKGGASRVIAGTLHQEGGGVSDLSLSDVGVVGLIRSDGLGKSELIYAAPGKAAEVVLQTGAQYEDRTIQSISAASEMNQYGQVNLLMQLSRPAGGGRLENVVVRVDPRGTDPDYPILPSPCVGPSPSPFCFQFLPIPPSSAEQARRAIYFDPEYALGYAYAATTNSFSGVEIPFAYGDGRFDLFVVDPVTDEYADSGFDVETGAYFSFVDRLGASGGLTRFALFGIEPEAQVLPDDPTGFVTGLTFVQGGVEANFSMQPLTVAAVPETSSWLMMGGGLFLLGAARRLNGNPHRRG